MSFSQFETSIESGQPIELYEITIGAQTFRYTSAVDTISNGGNDYVPDIVSRTSLLSGVEQRKDSLTISLPSDNEFAELYKIIPPTQTAILTIKQIHRPDIGLDDDTIVVFKGIVKTVSYTQDGYNSEILLQPLTSGLAQEIPRYSFQGLCNHYLYGPRCKVVEADFRVVLTATFVDTSGITITVPGLSAEVDGFWTGGVAQFGSNEYRLIVGHQGDNIQVILPFGQSVVGQVLTISAGCDHTGLTCFNKFDNVPNYGGYGFVPQKDPFVTGFN